jgi:uncharacterized protein YjgD (DUF1641 family)
MMSGQTNQVLGANLDPQTIDSALEVLNTVKLLQNYLNDQVIQDVSKALAPMAKLMNAVVSTDLIDILERSLQDPEFDKALLDPPRVGGIWGLMGALRDKDAQKGLGVLFELLKALGRAATEFGQVLEEREARLKERFG